MKRALQFATMLSLAALALLVPMRSAYAAERSGSSAIPKLLNEVKHHAAEAKYDAEVLETHRRSPVDWRVYAQTLTNIKGHANDLFQDYYTLQRVRDSGTPAQREAIDKLEPLLRDMATSLTNTIQTLNAHQQRVNMPEFRDKVLADSKKINAVYEYMCKCTDQRSKI